MCPSRRGVFLAADLWRVPGSCHPIRLPCVGRPRLYCGQACRQRAYEQRSATAKAGLPGDVVLVSRNELDGLQDRLYQLRCALEDAQTLLTEKPTKAELERQLTELLRSTGRLDRLWVSERAG